MNTLPSSLRSIASSGLLLTLAALPDGSRAAEKSAPRQTPAIVLPAGAVRVSSVGSYVEIGTYRVQVPAKLGRPRCVLDDGSWLFQRYRLGDSSYVGHLLIRFDDDAVSEIQLVPTAMALDLQNRSAQATRALASRGSAR